MTGSTIAVTGTGSGIGRAVRSALEADGMRVIGVDLAGAEIEADLSTADGRSRAVSEISDRCDAVLDGLVCCAGLGPTSASPTIAAVNFYGVVELLDGLLPSLDAAPRAAAVVMGSNSATIAAGTDDTLSDALLDAGESKALEIAEGLHPALVYGQSKRAVIRAVRRRANEWGARDIRLNAIAPGPVDTPLLDATKADPVLGAAFEAMPIPSGRHSQPSEIAALVVFLLSEATPTIHGSVVYADGGIDAAARPDSF